MRLIDLLEKSKKHPVVLINSLPVRIEYETGDIRRGHNWETEMQCPYGHLLHVNGTDKERLDCFLHPTLRDSDKVFVIHQMRKTGEYDEDKVMLGFTNKAEALHFWKIHHPHAKEIFAGISEFDATDFCQIYSIFKMYDPKDCIIVDPVNYKTFRKVGLIENFVEPGYYFEQHKNVMSSHITMTQLQTIDKELDKIYKPLNINIKFSKHFADRLNDPRNQTPITIKELLKIFIRVFKKYGKYLHNLKNEFQAVMRDISTAINIPFILVWDNIKKKFDLVAKTIMRKDNFTTPNQILQVEGYNLKPKDINDYLENIFK